MRCGRGGNLGRGGEGVFLCGWFAVLIDAVWRAALGRLRRRGSGGGLGPRGVADRVAGWVRGEGVTLRLFGGRERGLAVLEAEGDLGDIVFGDVVFFRLFQLVTLSKSNFEGLSLVFLLLLLLLLARELVESKLGLNSMLNFAVLVSFSEVSSESSSVLALRPPLFLPFFGVSSGAGGGLVLKYGSKGMTDGAEVVVVVEVFRVVFVERVAREGVVWVSTSVRRVRRLGGD